MSRNLLGRRWSVQFAERFWRLDIDVGKGSSLVTDSRARSLADRETGLTIDQILAIRSLAGAETPQWAPDGSAITFVTGMGGGTELWNVSPSGGPATP